HQQRNYDGVSCHKCDHTTCGHAHSHEDHDHGTSPVRVSVEDHDHHGDPLHDNWYAHYTDAKGARHEHPVVFRARGVSYLTPFNLDTALRHAASTVMVFVYTQGCGLCEDAHPRFVDIANTLTQDVHRVLAAEGDHKKAKKSEKMLFAQLDVTLLESMSDADRASIASLRARWAPPGSASGDYPLLVVLRRHQQQNDERSLPDHKVSWYTGPLDALHVNGVFQPLVDGRDEEQGAPMPSGGVVNATESSPLCLRMESYAAERTVFLGESEMEFLLCTRHHFAV
ncbi:Hypothetical protein, putative, partial [Bodo saltans]